MEYGQFCPIAKATEIIGEKWTLLIIRELLMGGSRFNELHRGLSLISPTMLSRSSCVAAITRTSTCFGCVPPMR